MQLSKFFAPINKDTPKGSFIESHKYLTKAGFIRQLVSGIYSWLPLGYRVLDKISSIVSDEMDKIGSMRILMPCIQPASLWQESSRYDSYGKEMLRMTDRNDKEMLFGPTHEEVVSDIFRHNVSSYKSLPLMFYQIQWKFRDEIRPRFGIMRSREFYMKDAYSFDLTQEDAIKTYKLVFTTYMKILKKIGLKPIAVSADNGSIGGGFSHEFHVAAETGESMLYYDKRIDSLPNYNFDTLSKYYAAVDEKHNAEKTVSIQNFLVQCRGIEVGHIFNFDTKYSKSMNFTVTNNTGENIHPYMGSYGIGISRLVGAIVESSHDNTGVIWPKAISPFQCSLINISPNTNKADEIYSQLINAEVDVLYDDTMDSAGIKFNKAKLIGLPCCIIVGKNTELTNSIEIEDRLSGKKTIVDKDNLVSFLLEKQ
ncbi:Proline--tRNA ligase [Candidatus Xenohaliotis californiensis]|uniref:Proline--tRNA ligase n=1 Tax=Candidatus Xenohaliotis californiensis TaxID=84677 RepID=A0ABM9N8R6_9RICK|nr:Proline--tRNA ligase [Candidatus Xenohaliotis californiensis]